MKTVVMWEVFRPQKVGQTVTIPPRVVRRTAHRLIIQDTHGGGNRRSVRRFECCVDEHDLNFAMKWNGGAA
jgi:hypothetical protein